MEVDSNVSTARRAQQIQNASTNNANNAHNANNASNANNANNANNASDAKQSAQQSTAAQRSDLVAAEMASNAARGDAGRALLGTNNARTQSEPAQPKSSAGRGDVDAVYRDAGARPPSQDAQASKGSSPNAASGTQPSADAAAMQARLPGVTAGGMRRAARKSGEPEQAPAPEQPKTAGGAVAGSQDARETVRKLAEKADVPVKGVPMSPARVHQRAQHISQALMQRQTPSAFGGRPVEVTPAEQKILQGNDQAARQRTADEVGRREAQRDSIVQAVGKDNLAKVERAYEQMSEQQREAVAPQKNPQQVANNLHEIAKAASWMVGPGIVRGAVKLATSTKVGAAAKKAYDKVRDLLDLPRLPGGGRTKAPKKAKEPKPAKQPKTNEPKAPKPEKPARKPRTEEQKARRRELDEQRRLERARQQREAQPPPPPTSPH